MITRNFSYRIALIGFLFIVALPAAADTGLGFGWNQSSSQELVYRVTLETGSASSVGVIDGLRFVATGSHSVDPATGAALMVGLKDGSSLISYLFLVLPADKRTFSFPLGGGDDSKISYQQTFINPRSGDMYLLGYNAGEFVNQIFKINLNLVAGTLSLTKMGDVTDLTAFAVGTPKITSAGRILIPSVAGGGSGSGKGGEESTSLISFDVSTGTATSSPVPAALSDLSVCETKGDASPRLVGISHVRGESGVRSELVELDSSGAIVARSDLDGISATLAGSAFCHNGSFGIIGEDSLQAPKLYRYSLATQAWRSVVLTEGSLKYIAGIDSDVRSAEAAVMGAVLRFANVSSADIKACAAKFKKYFKRGASSKIRSAKSTLAKFKFTKKGSRYLCALRKS